MGESSYAEVSGLTASARADEALIASSRAGDRRAFAELWSRHYRSGLTVARQFTNIDADDLVSESFARIYKRTVEGGGPTGAFRPYLYTTIRNLACSWGTASRDVQVDEIEDVGEVESADEPVARALDRTLTVRAYRTLPKRWQTVLWYTEVEGLEPHDVAPLLGMTANAVAALSYRAREGLRKAWLQAHVTDATASGACQWTLSRLGDFSRQSLTEREEQRLQGHLAICAKCSIVSEEVGDVGARLALVMLPILLGGVAGGSLLATLGGTAGSAGAITASVIPALPASIGTASAAAVSTSFVGSAAGIVAIAASTVFVAAVGVGSVGQAASSPSANGASHESSTSTSQQHSGGGESSGTGSQSGPATPDAGTSAAVDLATTIPRGLGLSLSPGATVPGSAGGVLGGVGDAVDSTLDTTLGATKKTVKKTVDTVAKTTDKVTNTVDRVTKTVDKVGRSVDKVVTKVVPKHGSGNDSTRGSVGTTVDDVTDVVDDVTGTVDSVVGGLTGGLGGLLGR